LPEGDARLLSNLDECRAAANNLQHGQNLEASLILPKDSRLETGTLGRTGCTALKFKVEPRTGWHDPWADWYYSGILKHASVWEKPDTPACVVGGRPGHIVNGKLVPLFPDPPPQISFTLNGCLQFDKPGKYTISLTYRARQPNGEGERWNEEATESFVTLQTDPIEIEVLPESREASEHAAKELVAQIGYPWFDETVFLNFPDQERVAEELEEQLRKPQSSISTDFLDLLAFVKTRLQHPELRGSEVKSRGGAPV